MSYLFVVLSIVQIGWFCLCKQMTSFKKSLKNRHDSYMVVQFIRTVRHIVV